jgi:MFS family permease
MCFGRLNAGQVVHRLSPIAMLTCSSVLAVVGLFGMSMASSAAMPFASSFIFAAGVCFFWPTMLGVTSERFPKGGALLLGLMGAAGMASAGAAQPIMGNMYTKFGPGGSLLHMSVLPAILFIIFLAIFMSDKAKGGYKIEKLGEADASASKKQTTKV